MGGPSRSILRSSAQDYFFLFGGGMSRVMRAVCLVFVFASCGKDNPVAPSAAPTATRIIKLGGNLNFGDVIVGSVRTDGLLTISNNGSANLTFTGMTGPCGSSAISASPNTGVIAPGATWNIGIRFAPTTVQNCSGMITVASDQTSGTNTIQMVANAVAPPRANFFRAGTGDTVFDMPVDVQRVRIIGIYNGYTSNFVVRIGSRLIVNELVGTGWGTTRYDGTLLTGGGGVASITNSSGVQWSVEEVGR